MRAYDIIKKKRDGAELTDDEIGNFVGEFVNKSITDYQMSAFLMAVWFRGMTEREVTALTIAIRDSGEVLGAGETFRVDKHSTGGVGDKTSFVVTPIVAACGVRVAKMSGRGLGHTGGTIDKLESFEGLSCALSPSKLEEIAARTGLAIAGQSGALAPADGAIYALRDVTATVDSIPLIASSIMGKKLAANDDAIVLDVKCGSGAFMRSSEQALELARTMVAIGRHAGKKMKALVTDMDRVLGRAIGNSLEVIEAIEVLSGSGPSDVRELSIRLAAEMLSLAGHGSLDDCLGEAERALESGAALDKLAAMVEAQGGDKSWVYDTSRFPRAAHRAEFTAERDGFITFADASEYGSAALLLGAGRLTAQSKIDPRAGIIVRRKTGESVRRGDVICELFASDESLFAAALERLCKSTVIGDEPPAPRALIIAEEC